jgi:hypothetical protein
MSTARKIAMSSIWQDEHPTKITWITILADMDPETGIVAMSVPALAARARVTLKECEAAIKRLTTPDRHNITRKNPDGRYIEVVPDAGWKVIQHLDFTNPTYRDVERSFWRREQAARRARIRKRKREAAKLALTDKATTPER